MPSNHLILCHPLLLLPSIFPSIRVSSNESALHVRWPKYWSFSFSISSSNEYSGLISFRVDWLGFLAAQETLKSLLQHQFKSINSLVLSLLYGPILLSVLGLLKIFIYFWLCWVFIAKWAFSSCSEQGLLSSGNVQASHCGGFSCCEAHALGTWTSVVVAVRLQSMGSVVVMCVWA